MEIVSVDLLDFEIPKNTRMQMVGAVLTMNRSRVNEILENRGIAPGHLLGTITSSYAKEIKLTNETIEPAKERSENVTERLG